jgi:hypothetical protein
LNFELVFSNRDGEPEVPPPAYAFLPFYVDQDNGWRQALESFDTRGQYKSFRKDVIEFHSGIKPNAFYELQAKKRVCSVVRADLLRDRAVVEKAIEKLKLHPVFTGLELNEDEHEEAIDRLLNHLKDLRLYRQKRAKELADTVDERVIVKDQLSVALLASQELSQDFLLATTIDDTEILCPTCGTSHSNDFANRFSILNDQEACREFINSSYDRLQDLSEQVLLIESDMRRSDEIMAKITEDLAERKGDITLKEIIQAEGQRSAAMLFDSQIKEIDTSIQTQNSQIKQIDKDLKILSDRNRKKEIESYYAQHMLEYLKEVDVSNIDTISVSKIVNKIRDTGSDQPRAVLAYYLALVKTIHRFSSSLTAPMVIDSPNQQDQDTTNVVSMLNLIFSSRPENGQTILGTVSLYDQDVLDAAVITLSHKSSVLTAEEYETVYHEIRPYLAQM